MPWIQLLISRIRKESTVSFAINEVGLRGARFTATKFKLLWAFCVLSPIDAIRALQLKPNGSEQELLDEMTEQRREEWEQQHIVFAEAFRSFYARNSGQSPNLDFNRRNLNKLIRNFGQRREPFELERASARAFAPHVHGA